MHFAFMLFLSFFFFCYLAMHLLMALRLGDFLFSVMVEEVGFCFVLAL